MILPAAPLAAPLVNNVCKVTTVSVLPSVKCMIQFVMNVAVLHKSHSNPVAPSLYIAVIAFNEQNNIAK